MLLPYRTETQQSQVLCRVSDERMSGLKALQCSTWIKEPGVRNPEDLCIQKFVRSCRLNTKISNLIPWTLPEVVH